MVCCLLNEHSRRPVPPCSGNGVMTPAKPSQFSSRAAPGARPASRSVLLAENEKLAGGPVPLFQELNEREQKEVLAQGIRRVIRRRQMLFAQGTPHDGIYLIQSGRMRVFYTAPSGREITLAYWHQGNFVGGPEVFGTGLHLWSGAAMTDCSLVHFPGKVLRRLVLQIPSLAIGVIEGLAFKGKCYSALAQMVGATRQWVTISLKRLEEEGILTSAKSKIVIHQLDQLGALRGGTTQATPDF